MQPWRLLIPLALAACNAPKQPSDSASPSLAPSADTVATASPTAAACPLGELRLVSDGRTLLALDDQGGITIALAPGKATFELEDAGCLKFNGKLVAEMLPDGRVLSVRGQDLGTLRWPVFTLPHSAITIADDGALRWDPDPGIPAQRFVGLDNDRRCAAAMLIVALGEAASGASMAVVDGVAKYPPVVAALPESRCAHVPR